MQTWQHFFRDLLNKWLESPRRNFDTKPCRNSRHLSFDPLEERAMLAMAPELVADIGNRFQATGEVIQVGSTIFYEGTDTSLGAGNGYELWKTDLNTFQATLVRDINPGIGNPDLRNLTNVNGTLFFSAINGTQGRELWKSDGTSTGTAVVRDIFPGSGYANPQDLTNVGGTLYFRADNSTHGSELWRSDGTSSGTVMIRDICAGGVGSDPMGFTNVNGTIYFRAFDAAHGIELWRSDGTSGGTFMVRDICPGAGDANPRSFANVVNGARIVQRLSVEKCSARRGELVPSLLGLLLNERAEAHPPPEEDGIAAIVTTSQMATILPRPLRDADAGRP